MSPSLRYFVIVFSFLISTSAMAKRSAGPSNVPSPQVELVFALDTTGSMGGLLQGAKDKIWFIANEIMRANQQTQLKIGLVAYRDKGDAYITQITPLSSNLDAVYERLFALRPEGGGDHPEHVNKALLDAVTRMQWTDSPDVLKMVFLVGDAPPQMNYQDDVKHHEISKIAIRQNIYINTIQCGSHGETARIWKTIAYNSEGRFAAIPQNGGVRVHHTPYDDDLRKLGEELDGTYLGYGAEPARAEKKASKIRMKSILRSAAPAAAADRAAVQSTAGFNEADDLVSLYAAEGSGAVDGLSEEELPAELQNKGTKAQEQVIKQMAKKRKGIQRTIHELSEKRDAYIKEQEKNSKVTDSFDQQVIEMLKAQKAI